MRLASTAPVPADLLAQSSNSKPAPAANTIPTQTVAQGKRSFIVSFKIAGWARLKMQVNGAAYERVGILGKGGSSKVYSVLCSTKRVIYALKRVALDRADPETYQSYTNEIELLKRLSGHDRIIQLVDHQITFSQGNRPKMLMMVRYGRISTS
jgi:serine/threonine-protein kinase TTK/MPS1